MVFGWSRTVNPRGKLPQTNKPEKKFITAEDGEYRLEYDDEYQVRMDMDFAGGKEYWESTNFDPSAIFSEPGVNKTIAAQIGERSSVSSGGQLFKMTPTNVSKLTDVITGDDETYRFAMGLPDKNKASKEAFDETFNSITSPGMLRNYGNWRNAKIRSPEFREAIKNSRFENTPEEAIEIATPPGPYRKKYTNLTYGKAMGSNFDKWYNENILSTTYSPGTPRRSEELGMGRVRQPGDVRTSVFGIFENPVTGRGFKKDRTAEDWADSTGFSREYLARLTTSPNVDGFDAWALVDGKRRIKPDSDPYSLADRLRKAKKEGNRVPVGGMGMKIFDYDDAAVGKAPQPFSLPRRPSVKLARNANNKVRKINARYSRRPAEEKLNLTRITRFTENPNNPFSYPVGSTKRKDALKEQKRRKDAQLKMASGSSFWTISTPVNKNKKKFKPAGTQDTSYIYDGNLGDGDSFDPRGMGGGMT